MRTYEIKLTIHVDADMVDEQYHHGNDSAPDLMMTSLGEEIISELIEVDPGIVESSVSLIPF